MSGGVILPLPREKILDRRRSTIRGWVHERNESPPKRENGPLRGAGTFDPSELFAAVKAPAETPLLVFLSSQPPASLTTALMDAAADGHRVYVLATTGFGEGTRDPGLREASHSGVLVRRVADLPASGMVVGRGQAGAVWMGSEIEAHWVLRLSAAQAAAWFQVVLHLFWHHAIDEAVTTGKPLHFVKARQRPFDVALSDHQPVRLYEGAQPLPPAPGGLAGAPAGLPTSGVPRVLLTPPGGAQHSLLAEWASGGCQIVWDDLRLPPFVLGAERRVIALRSASWTVHAELEDAQTQALSEVVNAVAAAPSWRFHGAVALESAAGRPVWLEGAPKPEIPAQEETLDAGRVQASELGVVQTSEPATWPAPRPLSLAARWRWIVDPPREPAGIQEDKLHASWRTVDMDAAKRLETVARQLDTANQQGAGLAKKFVALAGALLGFGRSGDDLRREVASLTADNPFSQHGPAGALERLRRLRALEEGAARLGKELDRAGQDAERDAEIQRQRAEWERTRKEKAEALESRRSRLATAKETHTRLSAERREVEEAQKGEAKKSDKDEAAKKDLYAKKKKLDDEVSAAAKEVNARSAEVTELEEWLSKPFEPRAQESRPAPVVKPASGARFVPQSAEAAEESVPPEGLPAVGTLRSTKQQRYLVIAAWGHLDPGEAEAKRLSAKLVAPAEGT